VHTELFQHLLILFTLSIFLSCFTWGKRILFPFQIFTTWVHECWHAIAALLMGGSVVSISISSDASGVTEYKIPKSKMRQAFVASAGYLGSSATGCLIFILCTKTLNAHEMLNADSIVLFLCGLIILTLIFWIRKVFGLISVSLLAAALGALHYSSFRIYSKDVLIFLGIQTALNALFDIRTLFKIKSRSGGESDAHTLQRLFYLPAWFWAFLWMAISLGFMFETLKFENLI
jgi:hypothetical protein